MKTPYLIILFAIQVFNISGQDTTEIRNNFKGTRFVNFQSANLPEDGYLLMFVQHRFGNINGGYYEFFGLDQATMRLGFEYGFTRNFSLGFGRSTFMKTYDLYGKLAFIRQNAQFPLSITTTAESSLQTIRDYYPEFANKFDNKNSWGFYLHLAKTIHRISVQITSGYLQKGFILSEGKKSGSPVLGFGGSIKFSKKVSGNIEYLHDLSKNSFVEMPLSSGIDIDTGGHLFQLVISNSQQMISQAIATDTQGNWLKGDLFFGFNLIREFDLKYYKHYK